MKERGKEGGVEEIFIPSEGGRRRSFTVGDSIHGVIHNIMLGVLGAVSARRLGW